MILSIDFSGFSPAKGFLIWSKDYQKVDRNPKRKCYYKIVLPTITCVITIRRSALRTIQIKIFTVSTSAHQDIEGGGCWDWVDLILCLSLNIRNWSKTQNCPKSLTTFAYLSKTKTNCLYVTTLCAYSPRSRGLVTCVCVTHGRRTGPKCTQIVHDEERLFDH